MIVCMPSTHPSLLVRFRPEKNHELQVRAFSRFKTKIMDDVDHPSSVIHHPRHPSPPPRHPRLVMVGSVRDIGDSERVLSLAALAIHLHLSCILVILESDVIMKNIPIPSSTPSIIIHSVDEMRASSIIHHPTIHAMDIVIIINCPYVSLLSWYSRASIGMHSMPEEHFGIGIVEMMAAGLVVIAHHSGGPMMDIVVPAVVVKTVKKGNIHTGSDEKIQVFSNFGLDPDRELEEVPDPADPASDPMRSSIGYLANTVEEYSTALSLAVRHVRGGGDTAQRVRQSVMDRFSDRTFERKFIDVVTLCLDEKERRG